ncbi:MAG: transposase [Nitrospirae bacterium]|nr:MAG: transposase [Nitrospirota bacterium]
MVARIPKGVYTMKDKIAILKENAPLYKKASKKLKSRLLDELSHILHMNRKYIATVLRNMTKAVYPVPGTKLIADPSVRAVHRRGRKKIYTEDVKKALLKVWEISDFLNSKLLVHYLRANQDKLKKVLDGLSPETRRKLLQISPATVDRLLKDDRQKIKFELSVKGNPYSSSLKRSIKTEAWYEKEIEPGYVEVDLVHHSGASGKGEFLYTLTATELSTGWTELRALRNKAMVWTRRALEEILRVMPVKVVHIHSDNGSEFLNAHVQKFCRERGIKFTRSRPYQKNDCAYAESRNWSLVRRHTGYRRYDTDEEFEVLDKLLRLLSLRHNVFIPTMRLVERERVGSRVRRRHEVEIPLNRVLRLDGVSDKTKAALVGLRQRVDLIELTHEIWSLEATLEEAYEKKFRRRNSYEK